MAARFATLRDLQVVYLDGIFIRDCVRCRVRLLRVRFLLSNLDLLASILFIAILACLEGYQSDIRPDSGVWLAIVIEYRTTARAQKLDISF